MKMRIWYEINVAKGYLSNNGENILKKLHYVGSFIIGIPIFIFD